MVSESNIKRKHFLVRGVRHFADIFKRRFIFAFVLFALDKLDNLYIFLNGGACVVHKIIRKLIRPRYFYAVFLVLGHIVIRLLGAKILRNRKLFFFGVLNILRNFAYGIVIVKAVLCHFVRNVIAVLYKLGFFIGGKLLKLSVLSQFVKQLVSFLADFPCHFLIFLAGKVHLFAVYRDEFRIIRREHILIGFCVKLVKHLLNLIVVCTVCF